GVAHRGPRAAARRVGAPGDGGDRGPGESEAGLRQEGSDAGTEALEAVHPRPGRGRARRERPQVEAAPGDRAAQLKTKPRRDDGGAAGAYLARIALRAESHLA